MKKPKIVIVIPCWGRSGVFKIVSQQLEVFYEKTCTKIELIVQYVFSEGDTEIDELLSVYHSATYPKDMIYAENTRLGAKLNAGITEAKKHNYDYIMNFGSDDLIHPGIINLYLPYIFNNTPIIGISALYFYKKGELPVYFFYYNNPHVIGAARLIHRIVVNKVVEKFGDLYEPDICRGMDSMSARRMRQCWFCETSVYRGSFPYIVDIKSDININDFESIVQESNKNRFYKKPLSVLTSEYKILKTTL